MSGLIQEVRAKFSATAQGLLSSIRDMRQGIQNFGDDSQAAVQVANRSFSAFQNVINSVRTASQALGNNNGLNQLEAALNRAQNEFRQTGNVSREALQEIDAAINNATNEVQRMGNVSGTSMTHFEQAINGAREELTRLENGNFENLNGDINRASTNMSEFGHDATVAGNNAHQALNNASNGANNFSRSMHEAESATRNTDGVVRGLMKSIAGFGAAYLGFDMLKDGVVAVGSAMISGNADMETYQNTLSTVLKSNEKAADMLQWATQFAASTPFEIPDVVDATVKLQTYGISAKDTLTDIGNMAAITGKPLDQAIEAVADAQTGELERLKEFGITKQMLIDKAAALGKGEIVNAQGQITDMKAMNETLFAIMKDRYNGGMDIASKSFKGMLSNVQDALGTMARELGKPLFDKAKEGLSQLAPFMSGVVQMIKGDWQGAKQTLTDAFGAETALKIENFVLGIMANFNEFKQWIQSFSPTITNIGTIFSNLSPIIGAVVGGIVTAFQKVASVLPPVLNAITGIAAKFSEWEGFVPVISGIVAAFVTYKTIMTGIGIAQTAFNAIQKASILLYNAQRAAVIAYGIAGGGVTGIMNAMKAASVALNASFLANPIVLIIAALVGLGVALVVAYNKSETFRNFVNGMWEGMKTGFQAVADFFTQTIPAWISGIQTWFTGLWTWIQGFFAQWGTVILAFIAPFIGIPLLIYQNWGTISTFFTNLWNTIVMAVSGFVSGVVGWFMNLYTMVSGVVMTFVSFIQQGFMNLVNNVMFIIQPFVTFFVQSWENLKLLVLGIVGIFTSLLVGDFEGMKLGVMAIIEAFKRQFENIWNTIKEVALRIFEVLKSGVLNIANGIKDGAIAAWNWLSSTVQSIANALKNGAIAAWEGLKSGVINGANALKDGAVNAWNSLKSTVINAANALKDGAISAWNSLKSFVSGASSSVQSSVSSGFNGAKNAAASAWNGLVSAVSNGVNSAISFVSHMGSSIVSTVRGINLTDIGHNIIQGLLNGISNAAGAVFRKAQEIADTVKNKIKSALGIHSPSRVMAEIGVNIGQGLHNGIDSMIGAVGKVAGNMAGAVTDNMDMSGALGGVLGTTASLETTSVLKHIIDLANVPDGIDENKLLSALLQIFNNPQVKRTIDKINMDNAFGTNRVLGAN